MNVLFLLLTKNMSSQCFNSSLRCFLPWKFSQLCVDIRQHTTDRYWLLLQAPSESYQRDAWTFASYAWSGFGCVIFESPGWFTWPGCGRIIYLHFFTLTWQADDSYFNKLIRILATRCMTQVTPLDYLSTNLLLSKLVLGFLKCLLVFLLGSLLM